MSATRSFPLIDQTAACDGCLQLNCDDLGFEWTSCDRRCETFCPSTEALISTKARVLDYYEGQNLDLALVD